MSTDWETFQAAYQNASQEKRDIVDSPRIPDFVDNLMRQQDTGASRNLLIKSLAGFFLGAISAEEAADYFEKQGVKNASHYINGFNQNIPLTSTENPSAKNLATEIAEVEHEMESLHSIRTMSEDMHAAKQEEPTHSSSQDNILTKPVPSAPVAQAPSPDTPRWGSES